MSRVGAVAWLDASHVVSTHDDGTLRLLGTGDGGLLRATRLDASGAIAARPDGLRVAVARRDFSVALADPTSGHVEAIVAGATHTVSALAFDPSGSRLAVASVEGTVRVWDLGARRLLHTLRDLSSGQAVHVAWNGSGSRLVTSALRFLRIWDASSGRELREIATSEAMDHDVAFVHEGARIAAAGERGWVIADAETGAPLHGRRATTWPCAFAAGERELAIGGLGTIELVDVGSGRTTATFGLPSRRDHGRPSRDDACLFARVLARPPRARHGLRERRGGGGPAVDGLRAAAARAEPVGRASDLERADRPRFGPNRPRPGTRPAEPLAFERDAAAATTGAGCAVWSRRWAGGRAATVMNVEASPDGTISMVGSLSGPMCWGPDVAVDGGEHAAFVVTFEPGGLARRASTIPMSTCVNWPKQALSATGAALAFAFQNDGVLDGRRIESESTQDVLLVAEDTTGARTFARQLGVAGMSKCTALFPRADGSLLMVGQAGDEVDFDGFVVRGGERCVFLVRVSSTGRVVEAMSTGGPDVHPHGAALAADESILLWGHFQGEATFGGPHLVAAPENTFLAKLDRRGQHLFSGVTGDRCSVDCALTPDGDLVIFGTLEGPFTLAGHVLEPTSARDLFLMRCDPSGGRRWVRQWACPRGGGLVRCTPSGAIVVAGALVGSLDLGSGAIVSVGSSRNATPFLAAFEGDGGARWSRAYGDGERNAFAAMAACADGTVVVAGEACGDLDLGAGPMPSSGGQDVFLAKVTV